MIKKHKIFFGENGLSSTSANHIANLCKEQYQTLEEELNNIRLYEESIKLLDSNTPPYIIKRGTDSETLDKSLEKLEKKAKYQSLIAWLREALKAKEEIIEEVKNLSFEEIYSKLGIELPEAPRLPSQPHSLTEDEYLASLTVKERNRYYYLETLVSVIGKFIHKEGAFSNARKQLKFVYQNPRSVSGDGKDTIINVLKPSVSQEYADKIFFELQAKHREYQAELNGIKHKMELAIDASQDAADKEYTLLCQQYDAKCKEWTNLVILERAKCVEWKNKQIIAARDLKIIIPNDLQDIYAEISALGKEK